MTAVYTDTKNFVLEQVLTSTIRSVLVDTDIYTYALGDAMTDIPAGARLATSPAMTGVTVSAGALSVAAYTLTTPSAATNVALVYYVDNGADASNRLLAYIPVTPSDAPDGATNLQVSGHVVMGF